MKIYSTIRRAANNALRLRRTSMYAVQLRMTESIKQKTPIYHTALLP